ncbi:MAG: NBR1-Ig-like domain-containing protein [Chloroflexota bacterium]
MKRILIFSIVIGLVLLVGCNLPGDALPEQLDPTSAAIVQMTVEAVQQGSVSGPAGGDDPGEADSPAEDSSEPGDDPADATATPKDDDEDDGEHGTDEARFVSDVTIPDYASVEKGEEFTKTWRLQNVGTATWTTEYHLVFDDEEQMGAPDRVPFPAEVPPDGFVNISVDLTAPDAAGEHSSYWMLENEDGEIFGTGPDFDMAVWLIVVVSGDDLQTGNSPQGIAGGATITNATVTANPVNFSGSCPAQINFTYTVTTSSDGIVNYKLILTTVSPSGYVFDPPPEYSDTVAGPATLSLPYALFSSSSVTATARVQAVGSNTFTSPPLQFTINCN